MITFHSIDTRLCIKYRTGDRKLCLVCIYCIHMTKDSTALWPWYAVLVTTITFFDGTRCNLSVEKNRNNLTDFCGPVNLLESQRGEGGQWASMNLLFVCTTIDKLDKMLCPNCMFSGFLVLCLCFSCGCFVKQTASDRAVAANCEL